MNNIVANFDQITEFAKGYGLALAKNRAVLREYLQVKILDQIYRKEVSKGIIFIGGTALRLTRNIDRFSEDLDFDLSGVSIKEVDGVVKGIAKNLNAENINLVTHMNMLIHFIKRKFDISSIKYAIVEDNKYYFYWILISIGINQIKN